VLDQGPLPLDILETKIKAWIVTTQAAPVPKPPPTQKPAPTQPPTPTQEPTPTKWPRGNEKW